MENTFGNGQMEPSDTASDFAAISFIISQALSRARTSTIVKVMAVTNEGGVAPVGFVDAQPMVSMLDGAGTATPHGTIFHLPYSRLQGGANAIILDPQVGDIGIAIICDRDISSVKATKDVANPGSFRRFDLADGIYIGGILNGTPEQYVRFTATGISITSGTQVTIEAPIIRLQGAVEIDGVATGVGGGAIDIGADINQTGNFTSSGAVAGATVTAGSIGLTTHKHSGVTAGGANSGGPVP